MDARHDSDNEEDDAVMALWDQLKSRIADLQGNTKTQVAEHKSKDFAKASMAMCALIAAADGTITAEERRKTAAFMGSNDALSVFEPSELQQHFESTRRSWSATTSSARSRRSRRSASSRASPRPPAR